MKRNSFNVLFFINKAKLLKNGEASVCMRITVDGTRVENNIRKSIVVRELKTTSAKALTRLSGVRQRNPPEAKAANHAI